MRHAGEASIRPQSSPRRAISRERYLATLVVASLAFIPASAAAHIPIFFGLAKAVGLVAGNAKLIDVQARRAYANAERKGTCEERTALLRTALNDATPLIKLARDIYADAGDTSVEEPSGEKELTTYRDGGGRRLAYAHFDKVRNEMVIVFRGTRLALSDVTTDLVSITGIETAYYKCCLLYTSPSPRDTERSRMPSSA